MASQPSSVRRLYIFVLLLTTFGILSGGTGQYVALASSRVDPDQQSWLPLITTTTQIRGIQGTPGETYSYIPWRRVGYPTCGWGMLAGQGLRDTIKNYHQHGIRVLLTVCQPGNGSPDRFNPTPLYDAAQGGADAVQCGNEQMKNNVPGVKFLYWTPRDFARFYDMCERAVHAVRPGLPVLLGSLDPHVGGIDFNDLRAQVMYLNDMQTAMNRYVHPGGHWSWRTQKLGLINSWHDGYPDSRTNSLYYLFVWWAQQFGVNLSNGELAKHLWVVEGTACFVGCGFNPHDAYIVAVVHTVALITDVETTERYNIPFFYFSGKDFYSGGRFWPIGVLDLQGHPKPLRQDLPMGARTLVLTCSDGKVRVTDQESLLSLLYARCTAPGNYARIIAA